MASASPVVTHCLTACTQNHEGAYLAQRTTKYLQCILGHKPVVAFDWALAVARAGTVASLPTREEVDAFIKSNRIR